jgi:hypothetical protein
VDTLHTVGERLSLYRGGERAKGRFRVSLRSKDRHKKNKNNQILGWLKAFKILTCDIGVWNLTPKPSQKNQLKAE